jgi:hypothetical protein
MEFIMGDYTYADFLNASGDAGRHVAEAVLGHIAARHPEYKPVDVRPGNNSRSEWTLNFRKRPKTGKALCSLYSRNGALSMRIVFLGFMNNEALLRLSEFGETARKYMTLGLCRKCAEGCDYEYRSYYYADGRFSASSKPDCAMKGYATEYAEIENISEDDIGDILRLIDMQSKHMAQDPRDIRGNGYMETSRGRCGEPEIIALDRTELSIDDFEISDYANAKKIDKYTSVYYLTPMGAGGGLWYYHDGGAVCGRAAADYAHTAIPKGLYAAADIGDPMSFSARRVWDYLAKWLWDNNMPIRRVELDGACVPYFVRFYRRPGAERMAMYVPIAGRR